MRSSLLLWTLGVCACTASGGNGNRLDSGSGIPADAPDHADGASQIDAGSHTPPDAPPPPTIEVLRGVDRASAFSLSEGTTLKTDHGVKWTGVYIGGPCSAGSGWTKTVVATLASHLGWTFMPIYVGQQSAAICGAANVTASQGTTDGKAAVATMKTFGWEPNNKIPVCLDLEEGTYAGSPASAMAYAKAWRNAVRDGGYLAYIYSSTDAINTMVSSGITFDAAWPASWFYTGFANVTPSDLTQLGNNYTTKNRAWQYSGGFAVAGAGTVDADTSDLLLAPAPGGTNL